MQKYLSLHTPRKAFKPSYNELEIGETEFLEQGPVSDEDWPDSTDSLEDIWLTFDAVSKLKTETQTHVKMLTRGAGVVAERSIL